MEMREPGRYERWGPRRARQILLLLALLSLLIIVGTGGLLVFDALRSQRMMQAAGIGVLAIMAVLLWLRIVRNRWMSLQVQTFASSPSSEETGVWGVGGPGMRTPGATGLYGTLPGDSSDRRSRKDDKPF
jgi:hypothetical protein